MSPVNKLPFLWELGCEEIPASWMEGLIEDFRVQFKAQLEERELGFNTVDSYGTLRRLVVHVPKLAEKQDSRRERILGPPLKVARADDGGWSNAGVGFERKNGVDPKRLKVFETGKGAYVGVENLIKGRRTLALLPEVMAATLRSLKFPKFMSWDASLDDDKGAFPFGRPVRWMLSLYGKRVVPFQIHVEGARPVRSGKTTRGHRFLAPKGRTAGSPFPVKNFRELKQGLKKHHVLLDPAERRAKLEKELTRLERRAGAQRAGGISADLVSELVEWPGAVLGNYPEEFLDLPEEIRHTVLIHHQKYFPLLDKPAFIAVTNMPSDPKGQIRKGSERVVVARLRDAKFFWNDDLRKSLADRRADLKRVVFHRKLGSYAEKIERMIVLGDWLAEQTGVKPDKLRRAIELSKCDLVTGMVGEFPELQGITGGLYARVQKEPEAVARAIYSQYLPVGTDEGFPRNPEGVLLGLADRMDTLAGLFSAGVVPKGSRDPFGLRRAAIGVIRLLLESGDRARFQLSLTLEALVEQALASVASQRGAPPDGVASQLQEFLIERLRHQLSRDFRYDELNSVFADGALARPLTDSRARIDAVAALRGSEDFKALAVAFKRVRNILSKETTDSVRPELFTEKAEKDLFQAMEDLGPRARAKIEKQSYGPALRQLSRIRPQVDQFFDDVLVMAEDPKLKANRLSLLSQLERLFTEVADLSELVADSDGRG